MEAYQVEQRVQHELTSDETLLWYGQPRQGLMLRREDAFGIPFTLVWGGIAFSCVVGLIRLGSTTEDRLIGALVGAPLAALALYIMIGRFVADSIERSKTVYAVTSERVIIVSGLFRESVQSVFLRSVINVTLTQRADGTGTIKLGPTPPFWKSRNQARPPTLEQISGARSVYEMILQGKRSIR